jgi:hypothetical protein
LSRKTPAFSSSNFLSGEIGTAPRRPYPFLRYPLPAARQAATSNPLLVIFYFYPFQRFSVSLFQLFRIFFTFISTRFCKIFLSSFKTAIHALSSPRVLR